MMRNKKEGTDAGYEIESVEMFAARDREIRIRIRIRFRFIDTLRVTQRQKEKKHTQNPWPGHSAKLNNTIFMFLVIIILYSTLFCVPRCASSFLCVSSVYS